MPPAAWPRSATPRYEPLRTFSTGSPSLPELIGLSSVGWRTADYDCEWNTAHPLIEASEWQSDASALIRFTTKLVCTGGGDHPEAIEKALEFVNKMDEPPARVLLFADAPAHEEKRGQMVKFHGRVLDTDYAAECEKLHHAGVRMYPFFLQRGAHASAPDQATIAQFKTMASLTGGEAAVLSQSRMEKGDAAELLDAVCLQALDELGGVELKQQYIAKYRK